MNDLKSCPGCGANDYETADLFMYKCKYCGNVYKDSTLINIEVRTNIGTFRGEDGRCIMIDMGGREIIETRRRFIK